MKKAFTLAEVLITLTIIGVIAALTIPNLMRKWEDHHTVVAVKEAYAIMNNAIKMAVGENGNMEDWAWSGDKSSYFAQQISRYLKNSKYCSATSIISDLSCISWAKQDGYYGHRIIDLNGSNGVITARSNAIRMANGMLIMNINVIQIPGNPTDGTIGDFLVDINGKKGPNRRGYDVFLFAFGNNGIIINSEKSNTGTQAYTRSSCQSPNNYGYSCARYVILKGDVDYKYKSVASKWPTVAWW